MLNVVTCLWDDNASTYPYSKCYDDSWVEKLYRCFKRNLTIPFRFVLFTDRTRILDASIKQLLFARINPDYSCYIEPFQLNEPMILVGLDTVVLKNIDHLAEYCLDRNNSMALPHPEKLKVSNNGVALVPAGNKFVYDRWQGENDMLWLRKQPHSHIDKMWPGEVLSFKLHDIKANGPGDARIIYFHGRPKQHELYYLDWIKEHWK